MTVLRTTSKDLRIRKNTSRIEENVLLPETHLSVTAVYDMDKRFRY